MGDAIQAICILGSIFGGVSLLVWTATQSTIARIKAEAQARQPMMPQDASVLSELRELKQQVGEMQSTSHQFDISFDAALNRLESRVERLETKAVSTSVITTDTPQSLRNGQNHP